MNSSRTSDHMRRALELARSARPSPNPRVGAVVVADGRIVGEGFHAKAGTPHAEVIALGEAGYAAQGATLYVTLEPCCHAGKTGPCTEVIRASGISRVVVGMIDPDERVSGKGIEELGRMGIDVEVGVNQRECGEILFGYTVHRREGRPGVTLKAAITLDGRIATETGDSRWISGEDSRAMAHSMRAACDAVLVGISTILADDPMLTVRHVDGRSPSRVVMDTGLRTPVDCKLISSAEEAPVFLAHGPEAPEDRRLALGDIDGVTLLECAAGDDGRVHPGDLLKRLAGMGVLDLLVEGGARIHGSFARARLADRFALFVAPKLLGAGRAWIDFAGIDEVSGAAAANIERVTRIGDDLLVQGTFR